MIKVHALVILILLSVATQADILYFDYTAAPVEAEVTRNTFDNFSSFAYIEFTLAGAASTLVLPSNGSALYAEAGMATFFGSDFYNALAYTPVTQSFGATIDNTIDWDDLSIIAEAQVTDSGNVIDSSGSVYFGFRIDGGGGDYYYGWGRGYGISDVDTTRDPQVIATAGVYEMAINTTLNQSINVGVVPEPGTLGLLLSAGGALLLVRRQFHKRSA